MRLSNLRILNPAAFDTGAFSCIARLHRNISRALGNRVVAGHVVLCDLNYVSASYSTSSPPQHTASDDDQEDKPRSENDVVNPAFHNRNPRNLELLGIAKKRRGWRYQSPSREFYHCLVFNKTNYSITGEVKHANGNTVVSASTKEWALRKFLFSPRDVSAAENVGRVLAERCLESGITAMVFQPDQEDEDTPKVQVFRQAVEQGGVTLEEPPVYEPDYQPGIDYDARWERAEEERKRRVGGREEMQG